MRITLNIKFNFVNFTTNFYAPQKEGEGGGDQLLSRSIFLYYEILKKKFDAGKSAPPPLESTLGL